MIDRPLRRVRLYVCALLALLCINSLGRTTAAAESTIAAREALEKVNPEDFGNLIHKRPNWRNAIKYESVKFKAGTISLDAHLYKPYGNGPFPTVVWNHSAGDCRDMDMDMICRVCLEQGYAVFIPFRQAAVELTPGPRGRTLSAQIVQEPTTWTKIEKDNAAAVAAIQWLKQQPFVDKSRLCTFGFSVGGIHSMLAAQRDLGLRCAVAFAPSAIYWQDSILKRNLLNAARASKVPLLLVQAQNDYDQSSLPEFKEILAARHDGSDVITFTQYGPEPAVAHTALPYSGLWKVAVFQFINSVMPSTPVPATNQLHPAEANQTTGEASKIATRVEAGTRESYDSQASFTDPTTASDLRIASKRHNNRDPIPSPWNDRVVHRSIQFPTASGALPALIYKPAGRGPFRAIVWNHGSENPIGDSHDSLAKVFLAHNYVIMFPYRHGSCSLAQRLKQGEYDRQIKAGRTWAEIQADDVEAALSWLKKQPYVDGKLVGVAGVSIGAVLSMEIARRKGTRACLAFGPGAMCWVGKGFRELLIRSATTAPTPIFVLQAKNDWSIEPAQVLNGILKKKANSSSAKIYPSYGSDENHTMGHLAFAFNGFPVWQKDVFAFLDQNLK